MSYKKLLASLATSGQFESYHSRWLDVSVYNSVLMDSSKGFEHGPKVYLDIVYVHTTVKHLGTLGHATESESKTIYPEVLMSEMRQYSDDLVLMSESGD